MRNLIFAFSVFILSCAIHAPASSIGCHDQMITKDYVQPFDSRCEHPDQFVAKETENYIFCKCRGK